jgi:hypothetical protein
MDELGKHTCNAVERLMVDKKSGFAPMDWAMSDRYAYDFIVGRTDGKDFTIEEYK